jgi:hypothetical protein
VLIGLGGDPNEPCDLLQLSVLGDPDTVEWWTTALSREWSAGLALSVADLDPATNPSSATGEVESTELVVAAIEDVAPADLPRVAATGSCDGLPDDPPRAGPGPDVGFGTAREALAGFVADEGRAQDPPLPDVGYTEYWSTGGDDARSYVHGFDDTTVVVIDVERIDGSWQVARWEAAPC